MQNAAATELTLALAAAEVATAAEAIQRRMGAAIEEPPLVALPAADDASETAAMNPPPAIHRLANNTALAANLTSTMGVALIASDASSADASGAKTFVANDSTGIALAQTLASLSKQAGKVSKASHVLSRIKSLTSKTQRTAAAAAA